MKKIVTFFFLIFTFENISFSQYIINGSAIQNSCNCYTLTVAQNNLGGSVWQANKINLSNSFDFTFNVYLGCADATGADGIVFILQPLSTSLGISGGGMGFGGVSPSIGIALDTWQNTDYNDPVFDHVSIQSNGNSVHGADLAGPVQTSAINVNIEDCQWHLFRVSWNSTTHWLRAYFDDSLRVEAQVNLVTSIFNNDPWVYWGFSKQMKMDIAWLYSDSAQKKTLTTQVPFQPVKDSIANYSIDFFPKKLFNVWPMETAV
ncbi:MAG: hypothetical protein EPO57_07900, partial [Chitinophagaceae bacterium]